VKEFRNPIICWIIEINIGFLTLLRRNALIKTNASIIFVTFKYVVKIGMCFQR